MPSAPSETAASPLPLAPLSAIDRPLSLPEYYHASIGSSRHTLEQPRMQGFYLHGRGRLSAEQWRGALDQVAAANPGARLRMVGRLWWARWRSDGPPPLLRILDHCNWDLRSSRGAEFIDAVPLSLRQGPAIELVVSHHDDGSTLVALRCHHAVTDGIGNMHLLEELFRALRGEALLGSNAGFSDTDLMLSVGGKVIKTPQLQINWLTGDPQGDEQGDEWRRISLGPPGKNLLARTAAAMAEFHHRHSELPALFAVPVNLRRHVPGIRAMTNFSNMLRVPLYRGDGPEQFTQRLKEMLALRMETAYARVLDLFKLLPFSWIDRMLSRTARNYRSKKALETAVISNLGRWDSAVLSCPGFSTECIFLKPLGGSVFSTLICVDDRLEMTLNLPKVLAGGGRFDALEAHLRERLSG
jgi:hypothetical protein